MLVALSAVALVMITGLSVRAGVSALGSGCAWSGDLGGAEGFCFPDLLRRSKKRCRLGQPVIRKKKRTRASNR